MCKISNLRAQFAGLVAELKTGLVHCNSDFCNMLLQFSNYSKLQDKNHFSFFLFNSVMFLNRAQHWHSMYGWLWQVNAAVPCKTVFIGRMESGFLCQAWPNVDQAFSQLKHGLVEAIMKSYCRDLPYRRESCSFYQLVKGFYCSLAY